MRANCWLRRKAAKAFLLEEDPLLLAFDPRLGAAVGFFTDFFFFAPATLNLKL
jgi:hypothetical protein